MKRLIAALSILLLTSGSVEAQNDEPLRVIDGDTIKLPGLPDQVKIWGIDAPELGQICELPGRGKYTCGQMAALSLGGAIRGHSLNCIPRDYDHDRLAFSCLVDGVDLGSIMVHIGWAVDYSEYSRGAYAKEEEDARRAKRGLWAGEFERPSEYRERIR